VIDDDTTDLDDGDPGLAPDPPPVTESVVGGDGDTWTCALPPDGACDGGEAYGPDPQPSTGLLAAAAGPPRFDRFDSGRYGSDDVIGDPAGAAKQFHNQLYAKSCGVACQSMIAAHVNGGDSAQLEYDFVREALDRGWSLREDGSGTPPLNVGKLLESHGIPVTTGYARRLDDIITQLRCGEHVMIGVTWQNFAPGASGEDLLLKDLGGVPTDFGNHVVQVTGVIGADTDHPQFVINDPGREDGAGLVVPADALDRAWAPSGHFMVSTALRARAE
jgi:hypothetical protein